jgi:hypothetical protein
VIDRRRSEQEKDMTRSGNRGATGVDEGVVVPEQRSRPAPAREAVVVEPATTGNRWDRVRWGPVWAGALVAVTTFLVLQLLLFALGWLDLGYDGANSAMAAGIVSGVLALVAFYLGGLTAGASVPWRGSKSDGMLHGVLVWALSVAGLLGLALLGGSALAGPIGEFATQTTGTAPQSATVDPALVLNTARQTAGWTALGLGLAVMLAAVGGSMGTMERIWSKRKATTAAG